MKKIISLGIAAGLLASACAAYAYPTVAGSTGYGTQPNAVVAPIGQWNIAGDYIGTSDDAVGNTAKMRALYGIGNGFELGATVAYNKVAGENAWPVSVNAKYALPTSYAGFNFAAGALYSQSKKNAPLITSNPKAVQINVAAGRSFTVTEYIPAVDTTIGVNWTSADRGLPNSDTNSALRAFLGAAVTFDNNLTVAADVQSKSEDLGDSDPLFSLVARYPFTSAISGQLGITNSDATGLIGTGNTGLIAGLNFTFGGATEDAE